VTAIPKNPAVRLPRAGRVPQATPGEPGPLATPTVSGPGGMTPDWPGSDPAEPGPSSPSPEQTVARELSPAGAGARHRNRPPALARGRGQAAAGGAPSRGRAHPRTGTDAIASAMSEDRGPDSLDAHVRRLCDDLGLLRYHTHDSRRSPSGFPDLVCVGPRGVLFRELKRQQGKVSPEQREWLDALTVAGQNAAVWRPASLLSGAIAAELAGISAWQTRRGTRCVCDAYGSCPQGCPMCRVCGGDAA
jgi:VRR-NUC domain